METFQVKDSRMYGLVTLFDMQTDYFSKVLDGIKDEDTHNRLNTKANHIAWLAGSLVDQRFELARNFGSDQRQGADDLFKNHQGIRDGVTYPPLEQYRNDWKKITPILREFLVNSNNEDLEKIIDMGEFKTSTYELISFVMYREANIIGQIALWRRLLGYAAMNYM